MNHLLKQAIISLLMLSLGGLFFGINHASHTHSQQLAAARQAKVARAQSQSVAKVKAASSSQAQSASMSTALRQASSSAKVVAASKRAKAESKATLKSKAKSTTKAKVVKPAAPAKPKATVQPQPDTTQTGTIVGNTRSRIYHVPGQRGYHISGANQITFTTEAAAQAAGYRRSLR